MFSASKTAGPSGYNISRSVRLRSSASAYFSRTPGSVGNQKTFTFSAWVKRGALGSMTLLGAGAGTTYTQFTFTDSLLLTNTVASTVNINVTTSAVFRDPSAWYHIVLYVDTTQATNTNGVRIYVNGVLQTLTYTTYTQNALFSINNTSEQDIGRVVGVQYFDGYVTEINHIDGQALTPSSFGSTNATTGVWQPAKYTGTYGTNGFYLNFSDNSAATAAAIGKDYSGNGNNWTPNNISTTAGATYDSMTDVPTLTSATAANFAVLNPLATLSGGSGSATWTNGNLTFGPVQAEGSAVKTAIATIICPSSGKWYWEMTPTTLPSTASRGGVGIMNVASLNDAFQAAAGSAGAYSYHANGFISASPSDTGYGAYGASYTTGDVIGVALNMDAGTLTFYKNGTSQGTAYSGLSGEYYPAVGFWITVNANFGQRPFSYTPPSGFKALNTYNLPASTITNGGKYMAATLYTGTGASQSVTNAGSFKPDLVWVKSRSAATDHKLTDSVRGTTKALISDTTGAETTDTNGLTAFGSAGFTVGSDTTYNNNTATYVGWQWQAGQGSTSSNTNGSITSTVSVNATAGFSIVTYTGTGANATVGHGLGVAPAMMICKIRNSVSTENWYVWHQSISGSTPYIYLNLTNAAVTGDSTRWTAAPTSTLINLGSNSACNGNTGTYVTYCWSQIAGFSKFGSYTGNGSADGPFVYCGFRPRYILVKNVSAATDWQVRDTSRDPYNIADHVLYPNGSYAETSADGRNIDILSNGFKVRWTGSTDNGSGNTIIYAAFAENPFANALAR